MEVSSSCIHVNPNAPTEAFPNIVQFKFKHLRNYKSYKQVRGEPAKCSECQAILLQSATCSFCNTSNKLNSTQTQQIPDSENVEFVINEKKYGDKYIVFCLDLSGSMGDPVFIDERIQLPTDEIQDVREQKRIEDLRQMFGEEFSLEAQMQYKNTVQIPKGKRQVTRMEMIQAGVIKNLETIQEISGEKRVAIVTFNGNVTIVGDGTFDKLTMKKLDELNSERDIESFVRQIPTINHIDWNKGLLAKQVFDFENYGPTALGPALYASVLIAGRERGSNVLLLTDGKPNLGLGALDDESQKNASVKFYERIAEMASLKGVTISIGTIKDEDSNLNILEKVANETAGRLFVLDPSNLDEIVYEFAESTRLITTLATNMELTIIAPEEFYFKDYSPGYNNSNKLTKKIGNIKRNTEIGFELVGRKDERKHIGNQIPIQLQLSYKSDDGAEVIRAMTIHVDVTDDVIKVEKNADRCIMGSYVLRTKASSKINSSEIFALARKVSTIATDKDDKFDKGKFETEINNIGVKLDNNDNDDNDSVIVKSTRPGKALSEDNPIDDLSVSLRNKASQATSESLKKKDNK